MIFIVLKYPFGDACMNVRFEKEAYAKYGPN